MDSPAIFCGIGGMCSPPDTNAAGDFHRIDHSWGNRNSHRLFRRSPLSDADGMTFLPFQIFYISLYSNKQQIRRAYIGMIRRICFSEILCPAKDSCLQLINFLSHPQKPLIDIRDLHGIGFQFFLYFFILFFVDPAVLITELVL